MTLELKPKPSKTVKEILANEPSGPSLRLAYKQGIAWAVMFGAGEASLALFANHLEAPYFVYGFLVGVPSLLGPLSQVVAANLLDRFKNRVLLVLIPVIIQALVFLPLVFIPFIKPSPGNNLFSLEIIIFLSAVTIYFISGHMSTPSWSSMISDFVPEKSRSQIFAWISRAPTFMAFVAQMVVGLGLYLANSKEQAATVFAAAFLLCLLSRLMSAFFISKMKAPAYVFDKKDTFTFWQFIKRAPESNFVKFVLFSSFITLGANIAAPYFLPYWTDELKFKQWEWVLLSSAGTVSSILTMMAWGRFSESFGNKQALKICAIGISSTPFLWLITKDIYCLFGIQMIGTIFWTGFNLSSFNYILEAASPGKRARCVAYYNILLGLGTLLGSGLGYLIFKFAPQGLLGEYSNFAWVLIISGAIRVLGCLFFIPLFKELREVSTFNMRTFFVQVINIRSIYGIKFMVHKISLDPEINKKDTSDD